ncbi:MAG: four-carbon acid sugar kinase family protein [Thiolinea sp.]
MSQPELLIIADDLTGALDAAVPFCSANNKVVVAVSLAALPAALQSGAAVVAVSTQSRETDPATAFARVRSAVERANHIPIFKKIDSRLKGNLVSELNALPDAPLLVAPALPSMHRMVRNAQVCGFGIDEPIDIVKALGEHARRSLIPDTVTEHDMDKVIAEGSRRIWVGARGLSAALARSMGIDANKPAPLSGRTAMAIGSVDPITVAQVKGWILNRLSGCLRLQVVIRASTRVISILSCRW